jgi:REP element-mobilizing transposase RayT
MIHGGNAQQQIFSDDRDRNRFLEILGDVITRYGWICHAYCLMNNHYHLLIETPQAHLSRGMQLLNGVYTQWFNRRHKRVGHLFQGRFKGILVEKDNYLLELARYIVLNPVRAKMVGSVCDWPWSSYTATAGEQQPPAFLTVEQILIQFDPDHKRATYAYRQFVREGLTVDVWDELQAGLLLGSDQFVDGLRPLLNDKSLDPEYRKCERFAARPSLQELFVDVTDKPTRDERIYQAVRVHHYTLKEVGGFVGLRYSAISEIAKRVHQRKKPVK